jgi:hypothetical protein
LRQPHLYLHLFAFLPSLLAYRNRMSEGVVGNAKRMKVQTLKLRVKIAATTRTSPVLRTMQ